MMISRKASLIIGTAIRFIISLGHSHGQARRLEATGLFKPALVPASPPDLPLRLSSRNARNAFATRIKSLYYGRGLLAFLR